MSKLRNSPSGHARRRFDCEPSQRLSSSDSLSPAFFKSDAGLKRSHLQRFGVACDPAKARLFPDNVAQRIDVLSLNRSAFQVSQIRLSADAR